MVRKKKKPQIDLSFLSCWPDALSWGLTKFVLHKAGLKSAPFAKWMEGQTCGVLEHEDGTLEAGIYKDDLIRYIRHKVHGDVLIWD